MHTPMQEAIAQVVFWTSLVSFPISFVFFANSFKTDKLWKQIGLLALGSIALSHFLWYFTYLGQGLATVVGEFHPVPWWKFLPIGTGVAIVVGCVAFCKKQR